MSGSLPPRPRSRADRARSRWMGSLGHRWWWPVGLWAISMGVAALGGVGRAARGEANRPGIGLSGPREADPGALLVAYFQRLLEDRDLDAFRERVAARYTEGALCRLLAESPVATVRRAAVVALGLLGGVARSNVALGRALRDSDAVVRRSAEDALWSLWFRADTPENNRALQEVAHLIGRGQLHRAEFLANRLIRVAPDFAEAYNQRAILYFLQGRFAESARDCEQVLSRNPYHFGALAGLARCQLQLDRPAEALKTLRRALKLQPYSGWLREEITLLEAQLDSDGAR